MDCQAVPGQVSGAQVSATSMGPMSGFKNYKLLKFNKKQHDLRDAKNFNPLVAESQAKMRNVWASDPWVLAKASASPAKCSRTQRQTLQIDDKRI